MSEAKKRKQDELNDDVPDGERKAREDNGGQTAEVTNAEIDEFFAILKRMQVAVKYFKEPNYEDSRKLTELRSLESEFGVEGSGVKGNDFKREEGVEENVGFNLNVDPEPEEEHPA